MKLRPYGTIYICLLLLLSGSQNFGQSRGQNTGLGLRNLVSVSKFWSHITSLVSCLPSGAVRYFLLTICCTWSAAHANSRAETADDSHGDMCVVALSLSSSSLSLLSTSPSLQTFNTIHFINVLPLRSFYYWTADLQACKLQQYTISPYWVPEEVPQCFDAVRWATGRASSL